MTTPPGPFDYEKHSLRWTLQRLMRDDQNLESLCKFVPRIANAVANITRIEHVIVSKQPPDELNSYQQILQELIEEHRLEKEES